MKNPSFGVLYDPLPSQSEMQGRKSEEEIQQPTVLHGCAKFAHHAKPLEAAKGFCTPCQISHGMQNLPVHRLR